MVNDQKRDFLSMCSFSKVIFYLSISKTRFDMADFSDMEDKRLVQIALKHEIAGTQISWVAVAKQVKKWKNNKEKLRLRLKALKSRFGPRICDFPRRYVDGTLSRRKCIPNASVISNRYLQNPATVERSVVLSSRPPVNATPSLSVETNQHNDDQFGQSSSILAHFNGLLDVDRHTPPCARTLSKPDAYTLSNLCIAANYVSGVADESVLVESECYNIVERMFQSIPRSEIRHKSSHPELNMGEVSMVGVTALLRALDIQKEDVFLDIGAGIGNVLAQVALQSCANKVLGIEVRERAALLAWRVIGESALRHLQFQKITMLMGDIRTLETSEQASLQGSTILYSFNTVFDHASRVALESLTCQLGSLRLVVVADKFCPRHERRQNCRNEFCTMWKMKESVQVSVTYSSKPVSFSIYERQ